MLNRFKRACLCIRFHVICIKCIVLIYLVGIHYTGTSVNPARSFGPALVEGGKALSELWVFIVGPFIGAAVAAALWKLVETEK